MKKYIVGALLLAMAITGISVYMAEPVCMADSTRIVIQRQTKSGKDVNVEYRPKDRKKFRIWGSF